MAKVPDHTRKESRILPCKCVVNSKNPSATEYQDSKYGKGNRVHNPSTKGFVCTLCGDVKVVASESKKDEKKDDKKK